MEVKSICEKLLFSTVRVEAFPSSNSASVGTAFVFDYARDGKSNLFLVTNKHLVRDSCRGVLTFNRSEGDRPSLGDACTVELADFGNRWIMHPREDIDVAIMPFEPVVSKLSQEGTEVFFEPISTRLLYFPERLKGKIDAVEDIIFIGYPEDVYDKTNMLPVVRKGITATPISVDFEGRPAFLIDASIFPGSSGSPVFVWNPLHYSPKDSNRLVANRILFLGIVASVYVRTEQNVIEVIDVPTRGTPVVRTRQMIGLGMVYKAFVITQTVEEFLRRRINP